MITVTQPASEGQSEQQKNWEFARQLSRATRADPASPYAGKYVGIARQQVVAVADTLDELMAQLDAIKDGSETIWIEASCDHDRTYPLWGYRCRA